MSPVYDVVAVLRWVRLLRRTRPAMIVSGTPKASLLSLIAAAVVSVPVRMYVVHGAVWDGERGWRRWFLEQTERLSLAAATTRIAVSDSLADLIMSRRLTRVRPIVLGAGSRMIVVGTPKAPLLGLVAARIAGVPVRVYVIHGAVWDGALGNRRRILEAAERATLASSTHQLAVSDSLARLIQARRLSRRVPTVLGAGSFCGVGVNRFTPTVSVQPPEPVICFVGRLHRDKGIDVLLRTLDRVREHVDASLTIVGGVDETAPPDAATMADLVASPHVNWVGEVSDVAPYLRQASILLLPTAREGLPQVVLEAQACGVPVVSWRVTGVVDAVRDGFTGMIAAFGDESGLAQAAVSLLVDPELRSRMAGNACAWVLDRFDRGSVVASSSGFLQELLGRSARADA